MPVSAHCPALGLLKREVILGRRGLRELTATDAAPEEPGAASCFQQRLPAASSLCCDVSKGNSRSVSMKAGAHLLFTVMLADPVPLIGLGPLQVAVAVRITVKLLLVVLTGAV